jgi:hypothetical protein
MGRIRNGGNGAFSGKAGSHSWKHSNAADYHGGKGILKLADY